MTCFVGCAIEKSLLNVTFDLGNRYIRQMNDMLPREKLMEKTIEKLSKLPNQKLQEVSDFAEFLWNKLEDKNLTKGIQELAADSKSFEFLEEEEVHYTTTDLKEIYK